MPAEAKPTRRFIDKRALLLKVPLSYPSIWKRMKRGEFPAPRYDGSKNFWAEDEIDAYLASLPKRGCYPERIAEASFTPGKSTGGRG
jgi:predicted DNA-binding transcriptional regulator AlpA